MSHYLLGLDIGTTNTKALLFDPEQGTVTSVTQRATPICAHHDTRVREIDPDALWATVCACIRAVLDGAGVDPHQVRAIGVASVANSGLPLDAHGRPLHPILRWDDGRSEAQTRWLASQPGGLDIERATGLTPTTRHSLSKLIWLRDRRPREFAAMRSWLGVADYVLFRLSGERITDETLAARTLAFDPTLGAWSTPVLEAVHMSEAIFPRVLASGTAVGALTPAASAATGLSVSTQVVCGGHDHLCAAFAAGATEPGDAVDSVGTAEVLLVVRDRRLVRAAASGVDYSSYRHVVPDRWIVLAPIGPAGALIDNLATLLLPDLATLAPPARRAAVARLLDQALGAPDPETPWPAGLLSGQTHWSERAWQAAILAHGGTAEPARVLRSLLRALAGRFATVLDGLCTLTPTAVERPISALGGAAWPAYLTLKSRIARCALASLDVSQPTALGAALLAGLGIGLFADPAAACQCVRLQRRIYARQSDV